MTEKIKFYKTGDPYGSFSNFSKHPIMLKGRVWPTVEHYFQAQKFVDTKHEEAVRTCDGPGSAAKMGRDKNLPLRKDWETVKESVMKEALLTKIKQHKDILDLLISTKDAELIEHTVNDSYWGDGGDGSGKNRLGILWMEIRDNLNK